MRDKCVAGCFAAIARSMREEQKERWSRQRKFRERKGYSCEASRLQAQPLPNGPVRQGMRP